MTKDNIPLTKEYATLIQPLLGLAHQAYGSRTTDSPAHEASREMTRLLVEYYEDKGGSLLYLARELGVTQAGLRRRVVTAKLDNEPKTTRVVHSQITYDRAAARILKAKAKGHKAYHAAVYKEYTDNGLSLTKIAQTMGLSSSNPLYFAKDRHKLRLQEAAAKKVASGRA